MRTLVFSALPNLDETGMGRVIRDYPRKKSMVDDRICLVKVGRGSDVQVEVDRLKPVFDLRPMGCEPFVSADHHDEVGVIIPWTAHIGSLSTVPMSAWATPANFRDLLKIAVFDWVIANDDRWPKNVLILDDKTFLAIDEGNAGAIEKIEAGKRWVKYKPGIIWFCLQQMTWLRDYVAALKHQRLETTIGFVRERFARIDDVMPAIEAQLRAALNGLDRASHRD